LAELLIALAILGVVATFTIPKVLQSQQSSRFNSSAKEMAGMLTGALTVYKTSNTVTSSTATTDLTHYFNYVAVDTATTIDGAQGGTTISCGTLGGTCLIMHNGGRVFYWYTDSFGGTSGLYCLRFVFDPDGQVTDGTTNGPGKSVEFFLYTDGSIRTYGTTKSSTICGPWPYPSPDPTQDPPWFSWS